MMTAAVEEKLRDIFSLVLELAPGTDMRKVRRVTAERWDSLAQTSLIAAIESEFDITFDIAEMERLTSYEAALILLEERER